MKKVLIVVDAQKDFACADGALAPDKPEYAEIVINNIVKTIREFRANNEEYDIIFTKDFHTESERSREADFIPIKHCLCGEDGCDFHDKIVTEITGNDRVIYKSTFGSPQLISLLNEIDDWSQVDSVDICGFDTDYCVISNAIIAATALPKADINIIRKACWGSTLYEHEAALHVMEHLGMNIV